MSRLVNGSSWYRQGETTVQHAHRILIAWGQRSAWRFRAVKTVKALSHECLSRSPSQPPAYDSGMRGRIGAPRAQCYTESAAAATTGASVYRSISRGSIDMAACAVCRFGDGEFVLPLAPGRYSSRSVKSRAQWKWCRDSGANSICRARSPVLSNLQPAAQFVA